MKLTIEKQILRDFIKRFPKKAVECFEGFEPSEQIEILDDLEQRDGSVLIQQMNPVLAASLLPTLRHLEPVAAALDPAILARIVNYMEPAVKQQFIEKLPHHLKSEVQVIIEYPQDTAGALMETHLLVFHATDNVDEVVAKLRQTRGIHVNTIYIVDLEGVLVGRVNLQDVVTAEGTSLLQEHMYPSPWINEMAPKEDIIELYEKTKLPSVPVLNSKNMVIGVIRYQSLMSMMQADAMDSVQAMVGVSKDEKALSPPLFSVKKRLPWLTINLATTFVAAFVVGLFEDTIAQITALAVLLPVVAGQSGNTGAQSQAITMRGLALREIRLRQKWKVLTKEGAVGLFNGIVIGLLTGVSVFFWSQSIGLALVIGSSMVFAMVAASLAGAAIPMILTAMKQDPATSSSIILTTITDVVGFVSFLGFARLSMQYLI